MWCTVRPELNGERLREGSERLGRFYHESESYNMHTTWYHTRMMISLSRYDFRAGVGVAA